MFGYIKGTLAEIDEGAVTIDVQGIGIQILVGASLIGALPVIGSQVKLYTYTYVKEDAFSLFGFGSKDELELFKKVITVSGIGPKGGLALLSQLDASELRFAIYSADIKTISSVNGIGKKMAERLILELKDKIALDMPSGAEGIQLLSQGEDSSLADSQRDAVEALVALGYSATEASRAVRACKPEPDMNADEILKKALPFLL
ncbi:MAG: Holliday junction branch migration protein RuvA [Lachnospiraceae bacterium]|nr:Holliday junction branch migration protein RuvA [Lachnospiraceae bacterium]